MTVATLLALILAGGGGSTDLNRWDGVSLRRHEDRAAKVAFPIPLTQTVLTARHFSEATERQMKHVFTLTGPTVEEVEVGLFENPKSLGLEAWVKANLSFLRAEGNTSMPWQATPKRVPALVIEQPRSPQQYGQRVAIFRLGERMVVVSCRNVESPRAVTSFEAILAGLEVLP
jgi:hypothetical protein